MPTISKDVWITKEGVEMEIRHMASNHLLSTIHFIERNRLFNAAEVWSDVQFDANARSEMAAYYLNWPIQYDTLIAEAQRRGLIHRDVEGLVKVK
jgi:hypothetical protein